jgi:acetyl-CoA carboxylase carboxyl transferase subunit alpha
VEIEVVLQALATETPKTWEKVQLARHPQRPHTLDFIRGLCSDFFELCGDRSFADDQAIVGGVGLTPIGKVVVVGHQKGHNTAENIRHNFGMPYPEGFRKALRLMKNAEKFGMPLVCFLDTPGAQPDWQAEERGQAQAIAENLMMMASLRIPIVVTIIGEGGSGGALALGIGDRLLMLEHAFYSVASPEASASILWRDPHHAPDAARAMKITAQDLYELGIVDEIVSEPLGGAHTNCEATVSTVSQVIHRHLAELSSVEPQQLAARRYARYRGIGAFNGTP